MTTLSSIDASNSRIYPGFGTHDMKLHKLPLMQRMLRVFKDAVYGTIFLSGMALTCICTAIFLPFPKPISKIATSSMGIFGIGKGRCGIKHAFEKYCGRKPAITLDSDIIKVNEAHGPKLGEAAYCDVIVSNDVSETLEWKKKLIRSATQSIEWCFNFAGGKAFLDCIDIIEERLQAAPALKVHLILSKEMLEKGDLKKVQELKKRFPDRLYVLPTSPIFHFKEFVGSEEIHCKLLVVDGKLVVGGGSSVHNQYNRETATEEDLKAENPNMLAKLQDVGARDTDIIFKGYHDNNLARTVRGQFFNLYQLWSKKTKHKLRNKEGHFFEVDSSLAYCQALDEAQNTIKRAKMRFIVSGSEHKGNNPIENEIIHHMLNAKRKINFANLLFNPSKRMRQTLKKCKERKITLKGCFNGTNKAPIGRLLYALPTRQNYHLFNKVCEYNRKRELYHKKIEVFDDEIVMMGSFNKGSKSLIDCENAFIIEDSRVAAAIKEGIREDKKRSKPINLKKHSRLKATIKAVPFEIMASYIG